MSPPARRSRDEARRARAGRLRALATGGRARAPAPRARSAWVLALVALLVPLPHGVAQDDPGAASWADASGDVRFLGPGNPWPGTPSNGVIDHADLTGLSVGAENETHVTFTFSVARFDLATEQATHPFGATFYTLLFQLGGGDGFRLSSRYFPSGPGGRGITCCPPQIGIVPGSGEPTVLTTLYAIEEDADGPGRAVAVDTPATVLDASAGTLTTVVARRLLTVPGPDGSPHPPRAGDRITDLYVFASTDVTLHVDRLPDAGTVGDFTFQKASADDVLTIEAVDPALESFGLEAGAFPSASETDRGVVPGKARTIPLRVTNHDASKRIVNLTATVVEAADPSLWRATLVANVVLAANETAVVSLVVEVAGKAAHRESALVRVRGFLVGKPEIVGVEDVRLHAVRSPGPERSVLFLHSQVETSADPVAGTVSEALPEATVALNTERGDAFYNDRPVPLGLFANGFDGFEVVLAMDTPLAENLRFDLDRKAVVTLAFSAALDASAEVAVDLYAGSVPLGGTSGTVALTAAVQTVVLEVPIPRSARTVNATAGPVELWVALRPAVGPVEGLGIEPSRPELHVRESSVQLPLLDPGVPEVHVSTGEYLPSLAFRGSRGAETYVNPGRTLVLNASVANEGTKDDVVTVAVNASDPAWAVEVRPAASFRLASGERANISLLVRAPPGAAEGSALAVSLVATSGADPLSQATLRGTVTVTKAIDIPDEAPDEPKSKERKKSPGAPLPLLAALVALGAALSRRSLRRMG